MCYRWLISLLFSMLFFNTTIMSVKVIQDFVQVAKKSKTVVGDLTLQPLLLKQSSKKILCPHCPRHKLRSSGNFSTHVHKTHATDLHCCDSDFKNIPSYLEHFKEKHTEQYSYDCFLCNAKFFTLQKYVNHWEKKSLKSTSKKTKESKKCLEEQPDNSAKLPQGHKMLIPFILNSGGSKEEGWKQLVYDCHYCPKKVTNLPEHIHKMHDTGIDCCGNKFMEATSFIEYFKKKHGEISPVKCFLCFEVVKNIDSFLKHCVSKSRNRNSNNKG